MGRSKMLWDNNVRQLKHQFLIVYVLLILLSILCTSVKADPFSIQDNKLIYDTINSKSSDSISDEHTAELLKILRENREINTLILNSDGGVIFAAKEMADIIIDATLNTVVENECSSACVTMFLGGVKRTLELGGKVGFHASWWAPRDIEIYYEAEKEDEGWDSPFDFASWLYEDTQAEMFSEFEYLLERGVNPRFAIQTLRADSDGMWYPRRKELLEGGVVTERLDILNRD